MQATILSNRHLPAETMRPNGVSSVSEAHNPPLNVRLTGMLIHTFTIRGQRRRGRRIAAAHNVTHPCTCGRVRHNVRVQPSVRSLPTPRRPPRPVPPRACAGDGMGRDSEPVANR